MAQKINRIHYKNFYNEIKEVVYERQLKAFQIINKNFIELYWIIGQKIVQSQKKFDWGKSVAKNLSNDLQKEFPGIKGFSVQNLWYMRNFYLSYEQNTRVLDVIYNIGWTHHITILDKVKDPLAREYYICATSRYGWTVNVLAHKIVGGDFERFALSSSNNFDETLHENAQQKAKFAIKDHYIFDFLEMGDDYKESELENNLIVHMQDFIRELGYGEFAFLGRQFKITVDENDFFVDLLFYHRTLRCLVIFDIKVGDFQPEYVGKMNFYLKASDMHVKKKDENPSIGIILCREKKKTIVEYAFSNIEKPMGVATYSQTLPDKYKDLLDPLQQITEKIDAWRQEHSNDKILLPLSQPEFPPTKNTLNPRQIRFLQTTSLGDKITNESYSSQMNVSSSTALRDLKNIWENGYVKQHGKRKNRCYIISKKME